ncbi:MAG: uroporphyrinogen-III synthase [Flavobacteriales bacterium]|nr:uroporphyrinogen-III synthase [Flavobacteriales bacterium]MCB9191576.1 uroporphyrinogen-III synthase [Flavobacteriales bacterium]MCB9204391.1 uroporphyrinogen-III synthase [Flavobacteriales bacterium]
MKHSIFISRNLPEDSHLLSYLVENDWEVHHRSLIEIVPVSFEVTKETDWIFLSSSNGVQILFENYTPPNDVKIGVVGNATAEALKSHGYEPAFIGETGNMHEVGRHFAGVLGHKNVMFFGAESGSEKLRSELPDKQVHFTPIYRTESASSVKIPETEFVYLTSPSNTKAYLNNASLEGKKVIAIGNTTAEFLSSKGIGNVHIPSAPSEEHVIGLLRRMTH